MGIGECGNARAINETIDDVIIIVDMPDQNAGLALSLAVNASGAVRLQTSPLITPEELDKAAKVSVIYTPPGR